MLKTDSLVKTLMLGNIEGRRRRVETEDEIERVTGRKVVGVGDGQGGRSSKGGNRQQMSDIFNLFLKLQEETNYKCQIFFLLHTKLKGSFS